MEDMNLSVIINPGTAVTNFEEFKDAVRRELDEKYSQIEVSEERLKEAKDARARLNKAKASLKETMRSAQLQNDEILVVPKRQAKELEVLLDEYIGTLDSQIKAIEEAQREERLHKASETFIKVVSTYPPEVQEIAVQCKWITNPKWGNASYSALQIKKDCTGYCDDIVAALQAFEGEFRPQMLADYIKNGNLSAALLFGQNLKRQKEAYEAAQKAKSAPEAQEVESSAPEEESACEPPSQASESQEPKERYIIRIEADRNEINWLIGLFKARGIHGSINKERAEA